MRSVQVGDLVPDVVVNAHTGEQLRLRDFQHQKVIVLFFYPQDGTAICTKEACAFRDAYDQFVQAGAVVIGISADNADSHNQFAGRHRLPFYLGSDEDGSLRKAFGVSRELLGLLPGRVTYVIDKEGIVKMAFSASWTADRHVSEALAMVQQLAQDSRCLLRAPAALKLLSVVSTAT
jgi:peroxiredoxin Q/BCP